MPQHIKHHSITVAVVLGVLAIGAGVFVYSGRYDMGADAPHNKAVFAVMQVLRERSVQVHSRDITVPNLNDDPLILEGAGHYAAMCVQCHLRPGMKDSEIRPGLYPQPPNLTQVRVEPRAAFWVIKHGIKMSAMPAWGLSHDDPTIWSMVAFVRALPDMSPAQYQDIVARAPADHDMDGDGGHSHGGADHDDAHGAADMHAMPMPAESESGHSHDAGAADGDGHEPVETVPAAEAPLSLDAMKPKAAPDAEAVAEAFQTALQRGDRAAVLALLAADARISEGGHTQSRDEYAEGHLGADIAFLQGATITPVALGSMAMGDTAMVGSESLIKTSVKGKPVTLRSREMLKLRQDGKDWKIVSVQWQSAPVPEE